LLTITQSRYAQGEAQKTPGSALVSEIGSLSLEFTKLSQLTGDMRYYDAVQRISDAFENSQHKTQLPGMWPIIVDPSGPSFDKDGSFTLGGMSDSLYEYLPKQYLMLGGQLEQSERLYEGFIEVAKQHLFWRALNPQNLPILISGDAYVSGRLEEAVISPDHKGQHLTCFAGGMVGLASRIFNRPSDLEIAIQLTNGCVWAYNSTTSGIGPEVFHFIACGHVFDDPKSSNCQWSEERWLAGVQENWKSPAGGENKMPVEEIQRIIETERLPIGMVKVPDRRYILRPEAIESIFMMYRLTGDPEWMETAWNMFQRIEKFTRTEIAASALDDITVETPHQTDSMESFWLAETLKYFYLIFSDWDVIDLDKWVLNTEAHPLRRPDV
jgi:hypothetical protein